LSAQFYDWLSDALTVITTLRYRCQAYYECQIEVVTYYSASDKPTTNFATSPAIHAEGGERAKEVEIMEMRMAAKRLSRAENEEARDLEVASQISKIVTEWEELNKKPEEVVEGEEALKKDGNEGIASISEDEKTTATNTTANATTAKPAAMPSTPSKARCSGKTVTTPKGKTLPLFMLNESEKRALFRVYYGLVHPIFLLLNLWYGEVEPFRFCIVVFTVRGLSEFGNKKSTAEQKAKQLNFMAFGKLNSFTPENPMDLRVCIKQVCKSCLIFFEKFFFLRSFCFSPIRKSSWALALTRLEECKMSESGRKNECCNTKSNYSTFALTV
jgi:hypothetical protein